MAKGWISGSRYGRLAATDPLIKAKLDPSLLAYVLEQLDGSDMETALFVCHEWCCIIRAGLHFARNVKQIQERALCACMSYDSEPEDWGPVDFHDDDDDRYDGYGSF